MASFGTARRCLLPVTAELTTSLMTNGVMSTNQLVLRSTRSLVSDPWRQATAPRDEALPDAGFAASSAMSGKSGVMNNIVCSIHRSQEASPRPALPRAFGASACPSSNANTAFLRSPPRSGDALSGSSCGVGNAPLPTGGVTRMLDPGMDRSFRVCQRRQFSNLDVSRLDLIERRVPRLTYVPPVYLHSPLVAPY